MSDHRQRIFLMHLSRVSYTEIPTHLGITFTNVIRATSPARAATFRLVSDDH